MNSKEIIFAILVVGGLLLTGNAFLKQSSFDCYQVLFSDQSSCSLENGSCIKIQVKSGAFGLGDQLKSLVFENTDGEIRIQCAPDCNIYLDSKDLTKSDTVNQNLQ